MLTSVRGLMKVARAAVARQPWGARGAADWRAAFQVQFNEEQPEGLMFPRDRSGLDTNLNWSLADDGVTPLYEAYRNLKGKEALTHFEGKVNKGGVVYSSVKETEVPLLATDFVNGFQPVDIDAYEELQEEVLGVFSEAKKLFVEDGNLGSCRASQIGCRVISDSSVYAAALRNLLVAAPLHHPDTFPRPIKVYVSTLAAEKPGPVGGDRAVYEPAIYRDVDPDTGRATIIAIGTPSIAQLQSVITSAASQLMLTGGYRGKIGGGKRVQMAFAYQQESNVPVLDQHTDNKGRDWVPPLDEEQPNLLPIPGTGFITGKGDLGVVIGASNPAKVAGKTIKLFGQGGLVWHDKGVSRMYDGVSAAENKKTQYPAGTLIAQGQSYSKYSEFANAMAAHPKKIVIIDSSASGVSTLSASDAAAQLASTSYPSDIAQQKWEEMLKAHGTEVLVANKEEAVAAIFEK